MSSTPITSFTDAVATMLANSIVTPLVLWLDQSKGLKVTSDEIFAALNIPLPSRTPGYPQVGTVPIQMPNIPAYLKGSTVAAKPQTRGRKKGSITTATVTTSVPCIYLFQRGGRVGEMCGQPSVAGTNFCRNCLKKSKVKQELAKQGSGDSPTTIPLTSDIDTIPVTSMVPNNEVEVVAYDGHPGLYLDQKQNFILQQLADGTIVALRSLQPDGIERPLTEAEKLTATKIGFAVPEDQPYVT